MQVPVDLFGIVLGDHKVIKLLTLRYDYTLCLTLCAFSSQILKDLAWKRAQSETQRDIFARSTCWCVHILRCRRQLCLDVWWCRRWICTPWTQWLVEISSVYHLFLLILTHGAAWTGVNVTWNWVQMTTSFSPRKKWKMLIVVAARAFAHLYYSRIYDQLIVFGGTDTVITTYHDVVVWSSWSCKDMEICGPWEMRLRPQEEHGSHWM